jgi:putative heme-binding domain-containing protein
MRGATAWLAGIGFAASLAMGVRAQDAPAGRIDPQAVDRLYSRENLVAWCIVPFDGRKRGHEERAAMLETLGFSHFAYDWRAEHVPTFNAEVEALRKHKVSLDAWWAPGELNADARRILEVLKRHGVKAQLWVLLDLGPDKATGDEQARRVDRAAARLKPLAEEAAKIGCTIGLYNHGGWFGEPENQLAIVERLKREGASNVGVVYNLHHGHDHLDRFTAVLAMLKPHLLAVNLNGMDRGGDRVGRKILPLGQGELDLELLRAIVASGYRGPIGILGHTDDDAEARLRDNLEGLDWLVRQLRGAPAGPRPTPRTPVPKRHEPAKSAAGDDATAVADLIREARARGDARRGAALFASAKLACVSCHKVGAIGGAVGPDLSAAGVCLAPETIVESILWPRRTVKEGYRAVAVATTDGRVVRGYPREETATALVIADPSTGDRTTIPRADVEDRKDEGSLMPDGLMALLSPVERRNLARFLLDLGRPGGIAADALFAHPATPAAFKFDRAPLRPDQHPDWRLPVNRERVYDFYGKEAEAFVARTEARLLPQFPGLDGGRDGHWGNQNETTWADARWNETDLGTLLCGVFRGADATVPKGVCVRLGDHGEVSACFNPETLRFEAAWIGGFVKFSPTRHGFMDGLILDGTPLPRPEGAAPTKPFVYHGFYRHGRRVVFSYAIDGVDYLDSPWAENGRFVHNVAPAAAHPLARLTHGGGPARWPERLVTKGAVGRGEPFAVDTIKVPFNNPWRALMFFGDHDFLPDGSAVLCTMQGDVWRVEGLDESLERVTWRRIATGLHQALGLVVVDGKPLVLGRDQVTRLHDLDGDGEADFYECVSNAYKTSPAGHDFICGLQRDAQGRLYTASGPQGLIRISPDGKTVETLATGLRNPDGLGLAPDGTLTAPNSEGEWVPSSMVCLVTPGAHFGAQGPKGKTPPDLPAVYLPRGLDNSSGGQVFVESARMGPLDGRWVHLSFGAGTAFLMLVEQVEGVAQGAVAPLPVEFRSGAHRARVNPKDGWLYVSGMAGWGTYTPDDGSFQRVRWTGGRTPVPTAFHAHRNGVLLTFSQPIDRSIAERAGRQLVQAWNYRYSAGYGSSEWSPSHPGATGHDRLAVRSSHVLADGKSLFLDVPDLQPVSQLHVHLRVDSGEPVDLYATIHRLAAPFTGFPGYAPEDKIVAAHPILGDMTALSVRSAPNPWARKLPGARSIQVEAGKNLSFAPRLLSARPGEALRVTFSNPDVVPHNWVLILPGALARFGDLVNKVIAEPDAAARHYIPRSDDLIAYTDVVGPQDHASIFIRAPKEKGRYPFLCTFPGHWMVMNGELVVE